MTHSGSISTLRKQIQDIPDAIRVFAQATCAARLLAIAMPCRPPLGGGGCLCKLVHIGILRLLKPGAEAFLTAELASLIQSENSHGMPGPGL